MKRIWIKPAGRKWIKEKIKTTTFRSKKHRGLYAIVKGSWYNAIPIGMAVKLAPITQMSREELIQNHYSSEGDFKTPKDFENWLKANRLNLPEIGWLHEISEVKEDD